MHKLLAIDLDGTLLSWNKKISKNNLNSLKKYIDNGGTPIIITGKAIKASMKYIDIINKHTNNKIKFLASFNGNIIYDLINEKCIYNNFLESNICNNIYNIAEKFNLTFCGARNNDIFVPNLMLSKYTFLSLQNKFNKKTKIIPSKKYSNMKCFKINVLNSFIKRNSLNEAYKEFTKIKEIEIYKSSSYFYEIIKKNSNKGNALKIISKELGINLKNVASIGNSYNDIPMFKVSDLSIVIKKNSKEFKKCTKYSINEKDNVSFAIENYLL